MFVATARWSAIAVAAKTKTRTMSIHELIREGRQRLGLTHEAFAKLCGVSRSAVQQWEREDGTAPSRAHQPAVAKTLGISVSELMGASRLVVRAGETCREMLPVSVAVDATGKVVLTQATLTLDLKDSDRRIELTSEQTPLVAAWLYEAASDNGEAAQADDGTKIPIRYVTKGPKAEAAQLEVFCDGQGMVILKIDAGTHIEIAPAMAKGLREQLSAAIRSSLAGLLRPD